MPGAAKTKAAETAKARAAGTGRRKERQLVDPSMLMTSNRDESWELRMVPGFPSKSLMSRLSISGSLRSTDQLLCLFPGGSFNERDHDISV